MVFLDFEILSLIHITYSFYIYYTIHHNSTQVLKHKKTRFYLGLQRFLYQNCQTRGINIPSIIILRHTLLVFSQDFEEMIDNLEFIQKHKKLYKETICNIIKLLGIGQINMEKAEKEYKKRCLIYEQNRLKGDTRNGY